METTDTLRLTIEVERASPLSGWIGDPERGMSAFSGWVGLAAELDRLLEEGPGEARAGNDG